MLWAAGILLAALVLLLAPPPQVRGADAGPRPALLIDVKGSIGFVSTMQLTKALERAKAENAGLLIVRLDTPGGLLTSTREMIQAILASPTPVVVYVAPGGARAASAGTYIVYASHIAAMAPGTHLGAATPIALGVPGLPGTSPPSKPDKEGERPAEPDPAGAANRKAVNDAVAYLRTLAELKNRNADWAEKAVRDAATLTASDALRDHVIEVVAASVEELLAAIHGRAVKTSTGEVLLITQGIGVSDIVPDWKMQLLSAIADPNIAFILLLIGIYGIFFEFMSPGAVAPGVIGGISLLVAFVALAVLPVSYGGLLLLLLGVALMVLEAFTPSFGTLGVGGVVAFVLGALFLFDPAQSDIEFAVSVPVIVGGTAATALFLATVAALAVSAGRRPVKTGAEEMIGSVGEVVSWDGGRGHIRAHGEIWAAQSDSSLSIGEKVRVVGRGGLTLVVVPANSQL